MLKTLITAVAIVFFVAASFEVQLDVSNFTEYIKASFASLVTLFQSGGFMIPGRTNNENVQLWAIEKGIN